jgi:hypothetical protein
MQQGEKYQATAKGLLQQAKFYENIGQPEMARTFYSMAANGFKAAKKNFDAAKGVKATRTKYGAKTLAAPKLKMGDAGVRTSSEILYGAMSPDEANLQAAREAAIANTTPKQTKGNTTVVKGGGKSKAPISYHTEVGEPAATQQLVSGLNAH